MVRLGRFPSAIVILCFSCMWSHGQSVPPGAVAESKNVSQECTSDQSSLCTAEGGTQWIARALARLPRTSSGLPAGRITIPGSEPIKLTSPIVLPRTVSLDCPGGASLVQSASFGAMLIIGDSVSKSPMDYHQSIVTGCRFVGRGASAIMENPIQEVQVLHQKIIFTSSSRFEGFRPGQVVLASGFPQASPYLNQSRFLITSVDNNHYPFSVEAKAGPADNGVFKGQGKLTVESVGIYLGGDPTQDDSSASYGNFAILDSVEITGFVEGISFGSNTWGVTVRQSWIHSNTYGVYDADDHGRVNSGERNLFIGTTIADNDVGVENDHGSELTFIGSRLDYNLVGIHCFACNVDFYGGHMEQLNGPLFSEWGDYRGYVNWNGGSVTLSGLKSDKDESLAFISGTNGYFNMMDVVIHSSHAISNYVNNSVSNGAQIVLRPEVGSTNTAWLPKIADFTSYEGSGSHPVSELSSKLIAAATDVVWTFEQLRDGSARSVDLTQPYLATGQTNTNGLAGKDCGKVAGCLEAAFTQGDKSTSGSISLHKDSVSRLVFLPQTGLVSGGSFGAQAFIGTSPSPTVTSGPGGGVRSKATLRHSTNTSGYLAVDTGVGPSAHAVLATVVFAVPLSSAAKCSLSPANAQAALLSGATQVFLPEATATSFQLVTGVQPLKATTSYVWEYECIQ